MARIGCEVKVAQDFLVCVCHITELKLVLDLVQDGWMLGLIPLSLRG